MSILFVEGFDNMGAGDGATYNKWLDAALGFTGASNPNGQVHSLVTGRFGSGSAVRLQAVSDGFNDRGFAYNDYQMPSDTATLFSGFAFGLFSSISAGIPWFWLFDLNKASQIDMRVDAGGHIFVTRSGTVLCTSTIALVANSWYWIELGVFISPTVGWAELRINASLNASYYGTGSSRVTSNGNTRSSALSSVRIVRHGVDTTSANSLSGTLQFDDMIFNDNNGSVNNDFVGEIRVIGLLPNALGTHSDFTRVGGTSAGNYTAVNENPINGDTSYVASPTIGNIDTYKYPTLPTDVSQVFAVVSNLVTRRDDAGSRSATTRILSGGSEADAPTTLTLGTNYATTEQIMENNPVTALPWVISDVNAVESGPHVTA